MLLQEMRQLLLRAELLLQVMLNLLMEKLNQEKQQKLLRLRKNLQPGSGVGTPILVDDVHWAR